MPTIAPIITAAELVDHPDAVLADVRWYLDGRSGSDAYEAGHLPGAVFVSLDDVLSRHDLPATEGRHPLPDPEAFAAAMTQLGIGDDTTVIAYDDNGGMSAARLVVMLRMLGHEAALLDGGLGTWDGVLMDGPGADRIPLPFTPRPWPSERLASADEVAAAAADPGRVAIDARARERFTGEITQMDPQPGHIPGAANAPWSAVLDTNQRFRSADALREHFAALGIDDQRDVVAYCGSGVSACMNVLAIERAGLPAPRLYVGSWSGWSADPARGAELGAER